MVHSAEFFYGNCLNTFFFLNSEGDLFYGVRDKSFNQAYYKIQKYPYICQKIKKIVSSPLYTTGKIIFIYFFYFYLFFFFFKGSTHKRNLNLSSSHIFFLTEKGHLFSCGKVQETDKKLRPSFNQLGHGDHSSFLDSPKYLKNLSDKKVMDVATTTLGKLI